MSDFLVHAVMSAENVGVDSVVLGAAIACPIGHVRDVPDRIAGDVPCESLV